MALRIIRKSASQNQVEIIKGTREDAPAISLLFFIETEAERDALSEFLNTQTWIPAHAQCLIMKSHTLKESLRSHFSALQHTLKLLNEPQQHSWPARLQAFLSEAEATWCVLVPKLSPEIDLSALCQAYLQWIPEHPNTGLLAPTFYHEDKVLAAGQMLSAKHMVPHTLQFGAEQLEVEPGEGLYYFYQGLSRDVFTPFSQNKVLLSEAAPLPFCALNKTAYLDAANHLEDASHTWSLPWLAQAISQHFGLLQYRIGLIPHGLSLEDNNTPLLESSAPPENFPTPYQGTEQATCFTLYKSHGLQQKGTRFAHTESKG